MKKLFVAVLALAALAACNKDNDMKFVESNKKAVGIVITNSDMTRALAEGVAVDENDGSVGKIKDQAPVGLCATTEELVVLFANSANVVVEAWTFDKAEAGTLASDNSVAEDLNATTQAYIFHNVSESVTQVAVVRPAVGVTPAPGDKLEVYQQAAINVDAMDVEQVDLNTIPLYGNSALTYTGDKCKWEQHGETVIYNLYTAHVDVAPTIARVEVLGFDCLDLGQTTLKIAKGELKEDGTVYTGGYDSLALKSIAWGGASEYTFAFGAADVLTGVYGGLNEAGEIVEQDRVAYVPGKDTKKAIVWNIDPTAVVPDVDANKMVVTMDANRIDNPIPVNNREKTLSIGFTLKEGETATQISKFEAGKIYRINVPFNESNLDETNEAICVEVEVEIANWIEVIVTPEFGN